jgi:hypothetical protein
VIVILGSTPLLIDMSKNRLFTPQKNRFSEARLLFTTLIAVGFTAQGLAATKAMALTPASPQSSSIAQIKPPVKPNLSPTVPAIKPVSQCNPEVETSAREQYKIAPSKGISLEQFVALSCASFAERAKTNQSVPIIGYPKGDRLATPGVCKANGNFELGNFTNWQGANNGIQPRSALSLANPSSWLTGIGGSGITNDTTHQELVIPGTDPNVSSISRIPPGGGAKAVRIGNQSIRYGAELISKTFVVTAADAIVGFKYAAVLEDPGHGSSDNPKFMVRVLKGGVDVTQQSATQSRVNFGTSKNVLVADTANPFFQNNGQGIVYKNWDCAEINLGDLVGETVTIEFITLDCAQGGHFAYAYVDDFCTDCGKGPTGSFKLDAATSSTCGPGKICYDVEVPKTGTQTGTANLKLDIWQNGVKLTTLTAPTQTADGKVCFNVDPSSIRLLAIGPTKEFDYSATSEFKVGSAIVGTKYSGTGPDGTVAGKNNDYKTTCTQTPTGPISTCCPPMDTKLFEQFFRRIEGSITSPYGLKFDPVGLGVSSQYTSMLNAYQAYYNLLNYQSGGAITNLTIGIYLINGTDNGVDSAGNPNPPTPTGTPIEQAFIGFSNGPITQPAPNVFFNALLQPNKWYGIQEYSYTNISFKTNPQQAGFEESCNKQAKTWVRWQVSNGRLMRQTLNDGKLESVEVKAASAK